MHGYSMGNVSAELALHARRQKLGFVFVETGFLLEQNPDTVRAPDCAFVSARRLPGGRIPGGYIPLAPDLAVEVVSQWSRPRALDAKARAWLAAGTRLVWIIDPEKRTATVHRPGAAKQVLREPDFLDGEDVVPGFRVALADLLPPAA
jgi:Uma2 family endonuclease